jgi:peptidoglycan hydrolase CwlO-like protein
MDQRKAIQEINLVPHRPLILVLSFLLLPAITTTSNTSVCAELASSDSLGSDLKRLMNGEISKHRFCELHPKYCSDEQAQKADIEELEQRLEEIETRLDALEKRVD